MNRYTLVSPSGMEVVISDFGATIVSIRSPDRDGHLGDVCLGFDTLKEYRANTLQMGCTVGRYANRIRHGLFRIDGREVSLPKNSGPHHLHGGDRGFGQKHWRVDGATRDSIDLSYISVDGEEGYPGTLACQVRFSLSDEAGLRIDYAAATDKPTIVNLTNHAYFNLSGHDAGSVLDHELRVAADRYTPVDETAIPLGELRPVADSAFDFRRPAAIGARIESDEEQLRFGNGYDHNFVIKSRRDGVLQRVAEVFDPASGRVLEIESTEPGLQFYTANALPEAAGNKAAAGIPGKDGARYFRRGAFCLEAQTFPDAPNQPGFPSPVLRPGERYRQTTIYRLSART